MRIEVSGLTHGRGWITPRGGVDRRGFMKRIPIYLLVLVCAVVLGACNGTAESPCPIDDVSFCEFVEEIEPILEGLDSDAVFDRTALECCKGDFAWPDETGFDPDAPCVRSGAFRGEGSCLTKEEFRDFLVRHAPLSVDHLVHTSDVFSELRIEMGDTAILMSTADPDWYLVVFVSEDAGEQSITGILQVNRSTLAQFPEDAFVSWPPDLQPPNPAPGGVG